MEVEFWFDSSTDIELNGDFVPYRIVADIPDPYSITVYNDLTNEEKLFHELSPIDRAKVFAELNFRTSQYVEWTEKRSKELFDGFSQLIDDLNKKNSGP